MGRGSDEIFKDLLGIQEKMYRLFDEHTTKARVKNETGPAHWAPPVDIYETQESFILSAELPGMSQEEIHLEITGDLLELCGDRPLNAMDPQRCHHRIERPNGIFQRAFRLPDGIDSSKVSATYRSGVLRVVLPKQELKHQNPVAVKVET